MIFSLHAQAGVTFFGVTAEFWNKIDEVDKFLYVQGIFDGLIFSRLDINGVSISTDLSLEQYIHAIDEMYSDYRNALIPVPIIIKVISMELNGTPKDVIESELSDQRRGISGQP